MLTSLGISLNRSPWNRLHRGGLDLEKVKSKLRKFSKDRDWEQFHNPKNLATALSVEVAELLEIFQWSNDGGLSEIKDPKKREQVGKEIADIFNYLVKLVDILDIDLEKSKGKSVKYSEFND